MSFIFILIFFCVIFVSIILIGGWIVTSIGRFIGRLIFGNHRPFYTGTSAQCCANPGCRTLNPLHAHYCRRCGSNLTDPMTRAQRTNQRPPRFNANNGAGRQVVRA